MTKRSHTMSTQPAPAPNMTETSVIKHYKKQLIYRQHDVPDPDEKSPQFLNEVSNTKIYDLLEEKKKSEAPPNGKKVRRKRKNRNCRGQFRHEAMELIKLGTTPSHTLCKSKEPLSRLVDKQPPPDLHRDDRSVPQSVPSTQETVIHPPYVTKTILENPKPPPFGHALPQMVPERRIRKEPEPIPKTPPIHRPHLPEYRPFPALPAYPIPLTFRHSLPPPPPYPVARSPPRPVPRPPIRPIPIQKNVPYAGIHFPFTRQEFELQERKRRRHEDKVVAAIDLTVDTKAARAGKHKCHCECGKTYMSDPMTQEVFVSVSDRDSSKVPSYLRGKMVNGVLKMDGEAQRNGVPKASTPVITKVPVPGRPTEGKPPHLIEDILAKKKPHDAKARHEDIPVPIRTEPNRVIVSTKGLDDPVPRPKCKDYTVSNIIGDNRRQSVDIDTISISSSSSESVRSPRPKSTGLEKLIPHGKLFYIKSNNSLIRYFDDTQKKLFIESITSDGDKTSLEDKEVIELPKNTPFSCKDNLTVEEYVSEMTLVEKFIPTDFFLFYKFVTGYQICNNNLPVSFLTFLKVYNTNGLRILLERYINSLKQN